MALKQSFSKHDQLGDGGKSGETEHGNKSPLKGLPERWVSWDSAVGIVTGYGLDSLGLIPGRSKRFFSAPQRPDWL
jgi:hypothetical protein